MFEIIFGFCVIFGSIVLGLRHVTEQKFMYVEIDKTSSRKPLDLGSGPGYIFIVFYRNISRHGHIAEYLVQDKTTATSLHSYTRYLYRL